MSGDRRATGKPVTGKPATRTQATRTQATRTQATRTPVTEKQAANERRVVGAVRRQLLIDGAWRPAATGKTVAVEDPSTGDVLVEVADGDSTRRPGRPGRRPSRPAGMGRHAAPGAG